MSRFYSDEHKWALYEKYRTGSSLTELCCSTGITDKPLREWFRHFDLQINCVSSFNLGELRQKNAWYRIIQKNLEEELSLLHAAFPLEALSEISRISCGQTLLPRYGPNAICRVLKIRKSNLYYHLFRAPEETIYEKHNRELRPAIRKICEESNKSLSAETIRQQLMKQGFVVSKHKVLELRRELGLFHITPSQKSLSNNWLTSDSNILARQFSPPAPNMAWISDITMIKTDAGKCYLCIILDLYARRVIAARLSYWEDVFLTLHTFRDAFQARGRPGKLLFHSDRGGQYTANDFRELLQSNKVRQSLSDPGVPYDNAVMESFFAALKVEETHRFQYRDISDLTASLRNYLDFYNRLRPHSSIGNLTPIQAEIAYYHEKSTVK